VPSFLATNYQARGRNQCGPCVKEGREERKEEKKEKKKSLFFVPTTPVLMHLQSS
jgi:hypothetical protein